MPSPVVVGLLVPLAMTLVGARTALSQEYPSKPIHIVTSEAGGGADFAARMIAPGLMSNVGQPVVVENRPGVVPIETVAKAPPDGYTLLVTGGNQWTVPLLQPASYDPVADFAPVSLTNSGPNILVVHPSLRVNSVRELIALSKARPGALNYASGSTGSSSHLAAELFKYMAGVNIVRIPFKGTGPAFNGLISGQVEVMFPTVGTVVPFLKSGRLKALAITSAQPSAMLPGLPTVAASGVPGYESVQSYGMFAPAKTPAAIVNRLNRELVRYLGAADVKEKFLNAGIETVGSTPEQLTAAMKSEMVRLGKVIKAAGIRSN